jgi:hypothetical protein
MNDVSILLDDPDVKSFKDENDTIFVRGPWEMNNEIYDFKLIESNGEEDYCTMEQMVSWNFQTLKKLV